MLLTLFHHYWENLRTSSRKCLDLQEINKIIMKIFKNRYFYQNYHGQIDLISNCHEFIRIVRIIKKLYTLQSLTLCKTRQSFRWCNALKVLPIFQNLLLLIITTSNLKNLKSEIDLCLRSKKNIFFSKF